MYPVHFITNLQSTIFQEINPKKCKGHQKKKKKKKEKEKSLEAQLEQSIAKLSLNEIGKGTHGHDV